MIAGRLTADGRPIVSGRVTIQDLAERRVLLPAIAAQRKLVRLAPPQPRGTSTLEDLTIEMAGHLP